MIEFVELPSGNRWLSRKKIVGPRETDGEFENAASQLAGLHKSGPTDAGFRGSFPASSERLRPIVCTDRAAWGGCHPDLHRGDAVIPFKAEDRL